MTDPLRALNARGRTCRRRVTSGIFARSVGGGRRARSGEARSAWARRPNRDSPRALRPTSCPVSAGPRKVHMLSLSRPRVNRSRQGSLYALERLEPRLALTAQVAIVGETLTIVGTAGADRVGISATSRPHYVRVSFDGRDLGRFGPIAKLDIEAGDGNDVVVVGPRVRLPARIDGGAGNDRLRGGSGPDLLLGGEGNDTLFGSRGRDTLDGGPGSNRVIITQSMGTIWVSASARGEATRLLAKAYTLRPLSAAGGSATGPIVVGAADLNDPATVALLKHAYEAPRLGCGGERHPSRRRAGGIGSLLGHQGSAGVVGGGPKVALASFRKAPRADGQMDFSTSILMPRVGPTLSGAAAQLGRRQADEHDVERLTGFFSATPVTPREGTGRQPRTGSPPARHLLRDAHGHLGRLRRPEPDRQHGLGRALVPEPAGLVLRPARGRLFHRRRHHLGAVQLDE